MIYIAFGIGYEWGRKYSRVEGKEPRKNKKKADRLFRCIMLLLVVSAGCFVIEIIRIGYIPVFQTNLIRILISECRLYIIFIIVQSVVS